MMSTSASLSCSCLLIAFLLSGFCTAANASDLSMSLRHERWMARHGRVYSNAAEKRRRLSIFKLNVVYIDAANNDADRKYKLGVNQFADLTNTEFMALHTGFKPKIVESKVVAAASLTYENATAVPIAVDWRSRGAVTPVKNQGKCGCCWAFSAVAAAEGIIKLNTGKLIPLSVQELVDCDVKKDNKGCNGGTFDGAFEFIITNGGLTTESNYPYRASNGTCAASKKRLSLSSKLTTATITGYVSVPNIGEESLAKVVARQPVSVAIDAGGLDFQFYSDGVFHGGCGSSLNHGVTVVGYGATSGGTKYWLVKNSWGASWGEGGYMRVQRDIGAAQGLCGIAMYASYPMV